MTLSVGQNFQIALNVLSALTSTLPHLVMCVVNVEPVLSRISVDLPAPQSSESHSEVICVELSDLYYLFSSYAILEIVFIMTLYDS